MSTARTDGERNALVEANLPLVRWLVGRCTGSDTPHADRDDCAQAGALALLRAAAAFDESRACLATVATVAIRREIYTELGRRDLIHVPRHRRSELHLSIEPIDEDANRLHVAHRPAVGEFADSPVDRADLVARALKAARPRERLAMRLRFLEGFQWREVAENLGVSKECARQIVKAGIERARRALTE